MDLAQLMELLFQADPLNSLCYFSRLIGQHWLTIIHWSQLETFDSVNFNGIFFGRIYLISVRFKCIPEKWSCLWMKTSLIASTELTITAFCVPNNVKHTTSPYFLFHSVYVQCGRSWSILWETPRNGMRDHGPGGSLLKGFEVVGIL